MENDWWINYPTLEAAHQGAAALICSCTGGYDQLNDRTMNSQDFCGPVTIPSVNINISDALYLKALTVFPTAEYDYIFPFFAVMFRLAIPHRLNELLTGQVHGGGQ